jgi:hypothetical protein
LWVNDQLIIDQWIGKSASDLTGSITCQGGSECTTLKWSISRGTARAAAHLS